MDAVGVVAVVFCGLVAGVLSGLSWIFSRYPLQLLAPALKRTVRILGPTIGPGRRPDPGHLPPVVFAGLAASGVFAGLAHDDTAPFVLGLVAALALMGGVALTIVGVGPLHLTMADWPEEGLAPGYEHVVKRWLALNHVRALLALVAFVAIATAVAVGD